MRWRYVKWVIWLIIVGCRQSPRSVLDNFSQSTRSFVSDTTQINTIIDSLKVRMKVEADDHNAVIILNQLTELCTTIPITLNEEVIKYSKQTLDTAGLLEAEIQKAILFAKNGRLGSSDSVLKKAIRANGSDNIVRAKATSLLGESQRIRNNGDSALLKYKQALTLAQTAGDKKRIAYCFHKIGIVKQNENQTDSARHYYLAGIKFAHEDSDVLRIISIYNSLSDSYLDYENSTVYLDSAIKYSSVIKDRAKLCKALLNKSFICAKYNNYIAAVDNATKGSNLALKIKDTALIIDAAQVLAGFYRETKDFDQSINHALFGLKMAELKNNRFKIGMFETLLGQGYLGKKDYSKALTCFQKNEHNPFNNGFVRSLIGQTQIESGDTAKGLETLLNIINTYSTTNNYNIMAFSFNYVGRMYLKRKKYSESLITLTKGLELAIKSGIPEHVMDSNKNLTDLYESRGEDKKAFIAQRNYFRLKDSISGIDKIKEVQKIDYEAKEQHLKESQALKEVIYKKERENKEEELRSNKRLLFLFIGGFVIVLVLSIYVFKLLGSSRRKSFQISAQKKLVEEKQTEILSSIRYAQRIQNALMPSERYITSVLKNLKETD
jgi:tetratricopeptide (TPR) repeat protein